MNSKLFYFEAVNQVSKIYQQLENDTFPTRRLKFKNEKNYVTLTMTFA